METVLKVDRCTDILNCTVRVPPHFNELQILALHFATALAWKLYNSFGSNYTISCQIRPFRTGLQTVSLFLVL